MRHIQRKHNGAGKLVKQFIYGNSIFTPDETPPTEVVFKDQYSILKPRSENRIFYSNSRHMENNNDWFDKYFKPVFRLMEFQLRTNSAIQPLNFSVPKDLPQFSSWPYNSFIGIPEYIRADGNSQKGGKISRNYDGVSGFRAGICQKCLVGFLVPIGPTLSIQHSHKCNLREVDEIMKLDDLQYTIEFVRKVNTLPDLLFQKCKDWSKETGGQLYLIARKIGSSSESQTDQSQENYVLLQFLTRILKQSKVILNDSELHEFLKISKYQTIAFVTHRRIPSQENFKYMIAVSTTANIETPKLK
jgi:hypothetical protein